MKKPWIALTLAVLTGVTAAALGVWLLQGSEDAAPAAASSPAPPPPSPAPVRVVPVPSEPPPAPKPQTSTPVRGLLLERVHFTQAAPGTVGACGIELRAWTHVALSPDLQQYPCGTRVRVILDEPVADRRAFEAVVGDTMSSRWEKTVGVYVGPDEPAVAYGVTTGRLEPQTP